MSHNRTMSLLFLLAAVPLGIGLGCRYDENRNRPVMMQADASGSAATAPRSAPAPSSAPATPPATAPTDTGEADMSADDLMAELVQSVQDELTRREAQLGTNSLEDLKAIVRAGVDRVEQDGMSQERITTARDNAARWAERAAKIAEDSARSNITRVELMEALSQLSPLYPYVTEKVPPVVPPEPGTPIDPVQDDEPAMEQ